MELSIEGLSKRFGSKVAVDNISVTLQPGVYGLLGANGAGKTTLMRMVCDILKPTSGKIFYDGKEIEELGETYRNYLGYLPQDFGYYPDFTAKEYLEFIAAVKGLNTAKTKKKVSEILETVNLSDVAGKKIRTFSGGMKQRLGIAQAVINDPRILVLDEPTAGLDPKERIRIRNLISEFSQGRIVLLATHIVSDIEFISDKILLMKNGELVRMGSTEELLMSVADKVRELPCDPGQLPELESRYKVGNVSRRQGQTVARLVGDNLPPESKTLADRLTLEDVYLYYLEGSQ